MQRSLQSFILKDLQQKIVLLSGPRQVGKTTFARMLYPKSAEYLNADHHEERRLIQSAAWRRDCDLVIFDELHKIKKWKNWIKGIYDSEGVRPRLLVTGSARLDAYRRGGDSLAGRFFSYRLHPFSVSEVRDKISPDQALEKILKFGGFPEPFLKGSLVAARRWRRAHSDRILREDLLDIASIRDLKGIQTLVELLRNSVGSTISYESLARDIQVSPHTVKSWVQMLESLHILFVVTPYSRNIARSLLKAPKVYFYDTGFVKDDPGSRFENAVACALLKRLHFLEDTKGEKCSLHFLRDKEKKEADFLTLREDVPEWMIETKVSEVNISQLKHFGESVRQAKPILLVKELNRELQMQRVQIKKASRWLQNLEA